MSHLRAYYMNKGDMLELVRSQPKVLAKAAGSESDYEVLSMAQIRASERNENYDIGKYYDAMQATVSNIISREVMSSISWFGNSVEFSPGMVKRNISA